MKKLSLKKTTLSRLNNNALNNVKGGMGESHDMCAQDPPYTQLCKTIECLNPVDTAQCAPESVICIQATLRNC